jgi:hypothetical protein
MDPSLALHASRSIARSVDDICNTWNIPRGPVHDFLVDNSHLIWSVAGYEGRMMLSYAASHHLREFFTHPSRAQHLYEEFWILRIKKCQEAIWQVIESIDLVEEDFIRNDIRLAFGIREYFEQNRGISSSSAGILDLQGVNNFSAYMALLDFLGFLSKVPWSKVFLVTTASTMITLVIASWVCNSLVSDSNIDLRKYTQTII